METFPAAPHRSVSQPNLSDTTSESSSGGSASSVTGVGQFPRACSLDSRLDETGVAEPGEGPTVGEREIQMSAVIDELRRSDSCVCSQSEVQKMDNRPASIIPGLHCVSTVSEQGMMFREQSGELDIDETKPKPPLPPPRRRKQDSLPNQTVSVGVQTSPIRTNISTSPEPSEPELGQIATHPHDAVAKEPASTGTARESWKKQMMQQHLPPGYQTGRSGPDLIRHLEAEPTVRHFEKDSEVAEADVADVVMDGRNSVDNEFTRPVMSDSLVITEPEISTTVTMFDSPMLSRKPKHPLLLSVRGSNNSNSSGSSSSGIAFEDQDINNVLDKVDSVSSAKEEDESSKSNTRNQGQEEFTTSPTNVDKMAASKNKRTMPDEKNNYKSAKMFQTLSDAASKKFKMRHRIKLDKAQRRKAKYNLINRAREQDSKVRAKGRGNPTRRRPNTNSLDRDALRTGQYFSAGDVCDFSFSRSTSVEEQQQRSADTTPNDLKIWNGGEVGMSQEKLDREPEVVRRPEEEEFEALRTGLTRQNATESFTSASSTDPEKPADGTCWTQASDPAEFGAGQTRRFQFYRGLESNL